MAQAVEVDEVQGLPTQRDQHSLHVTSGLGLGLAAQEDVQVGEESAVGSTQVKTGLVPFLPFSLRREKYILDIANPDQVYCRGD